MAPAARDLGVRSVKGLYVGFFSKEFSGWIRILANLEGKDNGLGKWNVL